MRTPYFTVANGITFVRIILFLLFILYLYLQQPAVAALFFAASWGLDAIDGFFARLLGQATEFGSQLDKAVDRVTIGLAVFALIGTGYLPEYALLLLVKDFALLPGLTILAARNEADAGLGREGRIMTFFQGVGILWLFLAWPYQEAVVAVIAAAGFAVAFRHLREIV